MTQTSLTTCKSQSRLWLIAMSFTKLCHHTPKISLLVSLRLKVSQSVLLPTSHKYSLVALTLTHQSKLQDSSDFATLFRSLLLPSVMSLDSYLERLKSGMVLLSMELNCCMPMLKRQYRRLLSLQEKLTVVHTMWCLPSISRVISITHGLQLRLLWWEPKVQ